MSELACDVHGPLKPRREPYHGPEPELVWACPGFEGEGCVLREHPVPETSRELLVSQEKYWPGVDVLDTSQDKWVSWRHVRDSRRPH